MKTFDFSAWSQHDLAMNTLTGGGLSYQNVYVTDDGGEKVLGLFNREATGHRVKFMEALEDAAAGNEYRITVRVKLGADCTADRANVAIGVTDPFALFPAFFHEPTEVTKNGWVTVEFTHTLTDDAYSSLSVEQDKGDKTVAESLLVAEVRTELLHRVERKTAALDERKTLWLIGDSITCNYSASSTTKGWGMYIGEWLDDTRIKVCNMARAGLSTQSFIHTDGLAIWSHVCRKMKAGDYLIVSLGINDCSSSAPERRTSLEQYTENLEAFADEAHRRGVTLLFVTSTVTVENNPVVNFRRAYPEAMIRVAAEKKAQGCDIDVLDLNAHMLAAIHDVVAKEGHEYLVNTYYSLKAGANGEKVPDTTHHREAGSRWGASMIAELLKQSDSTLKAYCK